MTDYNDGKWHGHNGERCPVHAQTVVEVVYHGLEGKPAYRTQPAADLNWLNSKLIVAFRVIKQHREPRELWLKQGVLDPGWRECLQHTVGATLFREVLE